METKGTLCHCKISVVRKEASDGGIERIFAGPCDIEDNKDDEIDECEFFGGKGIGTMDDEEGCTHGEYHGNERDTL